ncbi:transcriptional regulator with XRE-family HTH domain [Streptosporangium becharense]|uniref:Transcriptional regulator with XRE-family HTH domain n=1 Tax=Streptosporangium becharense TaxID=1816182 RepID=A0A7W9ICH3_9ACTN|nr:helix-turn-helix domain-containing protein [Streptosporangium becharense]MBB5817674.1 transcriptional regulator with XRE-family HTH domain [Streptosporangium becharense]
MTKGRTRRAELAAFLRSRRDRITPEAVGLPAGLRRRTPGLRREEVALLAGVGVTWYTWLEQGRPINASVQVLDAVARTLGLDRAEREHLYRLADVPAVSEPEAGERLEPETRIVLDQLDPLPAAVYNARYDLLAWNETYGLLLPDMTGGPPHARNALWQILLARECCNPVVNREEEIRQMVATLRAGFGRHLGEPAWTEFIRALSAASPEFASLWAAHDVARPGSRMKIFQHFAIGQVRTTSTSMTLTSPPETRMVVYTPLDEESRERIARIRANPGLRAPHHTH